MFGFGEGRRKLISEIATIWIVTKTAKALGLIVVMMIVKIDF